MKVVIVGAGLGGLSAAITAAHAGCDVVLLEKNAHVGGKMKSYQFGDYTFDFGPNTMTMPYVFQQVIEQTGVKSDDYFTFQLVSPHMRNVSSEGEEFYFSNDTALMEAQIVKFDADGAKKYRAFIAEISRIYFLARKHFLSKPMLSTRDMMSPQMAAALLSVRPFETLEQFIGRYFSHPFIVQSFLRYATYIGSSPYETPATFAMIAYLELVEGVYTVPGGTASIALGFERRARELGVTIRTNMCVEKVLTTGSKATGVQIAGGEQIEADVVIVNGDVWTAMPQLFNAWQQKRVSMQPSTSAFVLLAGLQERHPELSHHNVYFSGNYEKEFDELFNRRVYSEDPTIYVCCSSKSDASVSPSGDNLLILVNAPAGVVSPPNYAEQVLAKLAARGVKVEESQLFEMITPQTLEQSFVSYLGALYGGASNTVKQAFFRPLNRHSSLENVYFVGGSVHPGGGSPLVTLGGLLVGQHVARSRR